jgi:hypothetical protein
MRKRVALKGLKRGVEKTGARRVMIASTPSTVMEVR